VVTGTIGDAALGLLLRRNPAVAERWGLARHQLDHLKARYLVPEPRNAIAEFLGGSASAAMDVSDGLAGDLAKLCRASGVAAEIEVARVPLSDAARAALASEASGQRGHSKVRAPDTRPEPGSSARAALEQAPALIETIITGGDDYEVLATVPPGKVEALRRQASAAGVVITEIGKVVAGKGEAHLFAADGKPLALAHPSFSHF